MDVIPPASRNWWRLSTATTVLILAGAAIDVSASPFTESGQLARAEMIADCVSRDGCANAFRVLPAPHPSRSSPRSSPFAQPVSFGLPVAVPVHELQGSMVSLLFSAEEVLRVGHALNPFGIRQNDVRTLAEAPVPTAVWLFGSAIVALLIFGRQRRQY